MRKGRAKRRRSRRDRTVQLLRYDPAGWVKLGLPPTVDVRLASRTFRSSRAFHRVRQNGGYAIWARTVDLCRTREEIEQAVAFDVLAG